MELPAGTRIPALARMWGGPLGPPGGSWGRLGGPGAVLWRLGLSCPNDGADRDGA